MSRTTYRLFNDSTRVSTAVEMKDGSILMVYPRMENFADIGLWKWIVKHEIEGGDSKLTLSTHKTNISRESKLRISKPCFKALVPGPLSPYTPPTEPMTIDPLKLGPTAEGTPYSPRPEFQEPIPTTPRPNLSIEIAPPMKPTKVDPSKLKPRVDEIESIDRDTYMYIELTNLQTDLAILSRTMNERLSLMDERVKALLNKLD